MLDNPGSVYADDPTISDADVLYRMVNARTVKWQDGAAVRANTAAFQDQAPSRAEAMGYPAVAVSVFLGSTMTQHGIRPDDLVDDPRWDGSYGVASITAGQARSHGQGIVRAPTPESPAHAMIFAMAGRKKTAGQSKALARHSVIVIPPKGLPPPAA